MAESHRNAADVTSARGITPTESEIYTALGGWLLSILPGWSVLQGQQNQTPLPLGPVIMMQITSRKRLSTNGRLSQPDGSIVISQSMLMGVQVQAFGNGAGDAMTTLQTLWRDFETCEWFSQHLPSGAPTHAGEVNQQPFTTTEKQYDDHWIVDLFLNIIQSLTISGESALEAKTALFQADTLPTTEDKI